MAPIWMGALDKDRSGGLTEQEFLGAFERWGREWDREGRGHLVESDLRAGLEKDLFGMGGPGGAGGPGGPGGGGFGGPRLLGSEGGRNGLSGAAGIEFEYVKADLEFEGTALKEVAVRYKGNGTYMGSRMTDKKSFKVDLNEFVKGQKVGGVAKLNLHNNITDNSWMNEPLSHALYRDAGVPAPRSSYARVQVSVPGKWTNQVLGLYSIVENPDTRWAEANFGTKKGAIFKPVTRELFADLGDEWGKYNQMYDPKTDLTPAQQKRVIDFARLVTRAEEAEFARRLPEFLDVDGFSRFMAVTVWLSHLDSILGVGQNYVVYLDPKTERFRFAPWDLDHSFGNFMLMGGQQDREQMSISKPWIGENRFLERVMGVPAVREAYLARLTEFQGTIFRPERLAKQVDGLAAFLRPVVKEESGEKLERFNRLVSGEALSPGGFPGGMGEPVKPIKGFAVARHESVTAQLAGKSEGRSIEAGGMFGGGGRRSRPGGPGRAGGPGGPGAMGPAMMLATPIFGMADGDRDGKVTAAEWNGLGERWWKAWSGGGKELSMEQVAEGLANVFPPAPGSGPPGPGRQ
jgi:hypothetical protein